MYLLFQVHWWESKTLQVFGDIKTKIMWKHALVDTCMIKHIEQDCYISSIKVWNSWSEKRMNNSCEEEKFNDLIHGL